MAFVEPHESRRRRPADRRTVSETIRNNGAAHALDRSVDQVQGADRLHISASFREIDVADVNQTAELHEQDDADTGTCAASEVEGVAMSDQSNEQQERAFERCAKLIANPTVGLAKRASCAGADPGHALEPPAAAAAMSLIARSARDLFGTIDAALRYLDRDNFDGTGLSTRELLKRGRGTSVIARLDELRFGTRG